MTIRKDTCWNKIGHQGSTEVVVEAYYQELQSCMKRRNYTPDCIFNVDETGITPQGRRSPRVIRTRGLRAHYVSSSDKENHSIVGSCSASAGTIPPKFIYAGKKRQAKWLDGAPPGAWLAMTKSSMIQCPNFKSGIEFFIHETREVRDHGRKYVLLLLDEHFAHIHAFFINQLEGNNICT